MKTNGKTSLHIAVYHHLSFSKLRACKKLYLQKKDIVRIQNSGRWGSASHYTAPGADAASAASWELPRCRHEDRGVGNCSWHFVSWLFRCHCGTLDVRLPDHLGICGHASLFFCLAVWKSALRSQRHERRYQIQIHSLQHLWRNKADVVKPCKN